ncbi:MAG: hypothetical protein ACLGI8_07400 [Acidimicrobiia bacterium]|jgi:hypothetical protein
MLVPAGFLVMLLLGAIAFDLSLLFLRQRQASSLAVDLANDLATLALDEGELRASGTYVLDEQVARRLGRELAEQSDLADQLTELEVVVVSDDTVRVTATVDVEYLFARAVPGARTASEVRASATAQAVPG